MLFIGESWLSKGLNQASRVLCFENNEEFTCFELCLRCVVLAIYSSCMCLIMYTVVLLTVITRAKLKITRCIASNAQLEKSKRHMHPQGKSCCYLPSMRRFARTVALLCMLL